MSNSELYEKITEENKTLDLCFKQQPPYQLSIGLLQAYSLAIPFYEKELEKLGHRSGGFIDIGRHRMLERKLEDLIRRIKKYLKLYDNWEPEPAPYVPEGSVKPKEKKPETSSSNALIPDKKPETPPATQQEPNPIMPPAVVPTNTDTTPAGSSSPSAGNTNNQAGGSPQTDTSTQQANTQQDKATQKENKPAPKEEEKPKNDLFTPTNILLMLLVVGGGFFLLTRKGK